MTVIQGTALDSGKQPIPYAKIKITLVTGTATMPGYSAAGELVGPHQIVADINGAWSADLTPNDQITPANTYYKVTENLGTSSIVVPDSGGPYKLNAVLATPPPTPGSLGITGVQVAANGVVAGSRPKVNLVAGTGVTLSAADDPATNGVDVTINSAGQVASVNNQTGAVSITPANIGAVPTTAEGAVNGVATLDGSGHLTSGQDANLLKVVNDLSEVNPAGARAHLGIAYETDVTKLQPDGVAALNAPSGPSGHTVDGTHTHPLQPWQFSVLKYGATGNLNCVVDAVTNGTAVVTSASGKFTPSMVGMSVAGKSFLTSGQTTLRTTVASYQSPNQVTLAAAATSTATGLQMVWGNDDTAAFQAAQNAGMAFGNGSPFSKIVQIVVPLAPGGFGYMIDGNLTNTDGTNAVYNGQIVTGIRSDRLPGMTIEWFSPIYAGSTRHWNSDYPHFTGCSLFSTLTFASQAAQATTDPHSIANGGNPAVISGPTGKFGYGVSGTNPLFNNITMVLKNISIINAHSASGWSICPFNFSGTARAHLVGCGFGTSGVVQYYTGAGGSGGNTDFLTPSTFSGGASMGGLMPAAGNNADSTIEDCCWNGGFTYGPLLGEHLTCKGINRSLYNWIGVGVAGNYGDGGSGAGSLHAIELGQFCIEACSYHLGVWGAGAAGIGPYVRGTIDTEGSVQIRGVTNIAANLQALTGEIHLTGSPSTPTFTFPTNLRLIKETVTGGLPVRGPQASPTYTLGTAQINTFYRDATVIISGGTVTAVKVSALAGGAAAPTMTTIPGFTSGTFRVPAGCWWEIDGTVQPTSMQWVLD